MEKKYLPLIIIAFVINPLLTIIGFLIYAIHTRNKKIGGGWTYFVWIFGFMCCTFISLINMMKVPEVDLLWYVENYSYAGKMDFLPYILVGSNKYMEESFREPLYGALVWVLNRCLNENVLLFQFTISMLEYLPFTAAIIYFGKRFNMRIYVIMTGIVLMCFFPYIFTYNMNTIRQTLANAILLLVMTRRFFLDKRDWVGIASMVLIHNSSALFVPLVALPGYGKPLKKSWIWIIGTISVLVGYQVIAQYLLGSNLLGSDNVANDALDRASAGNLGDYTFGIASTLILILMLTYAIYIYSGKLFSITNDIRRFLSVIIILFVFVLSNLDNDQIAGRFYHYAFNFMPMLLMVLFHTNRTQNQIMFFISTIVIVILTIYIHVGFWTFNVDMGGWVTPVFMYFI